MPCRESQDWKRLLLQSASPPRNGTDIAERLNFTRQSEQNTSRSWDSCLPKATDRLTSTVAKLWMKALTIRIRNTGRICNKTAWALKEPWFFGRSAITIRNMATENPTRGSKPRSYE